MNRLNNETSPYLLQHADNPVDWFPWGDEAFAKARAEDKPVLLSVGYSACHWCHVMAHESFEDEAIAALMNTHFVSVKVDREERPDVDAVYMNAVQAMTGSGGWPMTVALTPEGKPFFGGTYYPPEDRLGHPGFKRVLLSLADAWQTRRGEVVTSAETLTGHLAGLSTVPAGEGDLSLEVAGEALAALAELFDPQHGGFGGAPKFPPHGALAFLLLRPETEAKAMAYATLEKMAAGGIFDQIGGGFARYSVDAHWLVPHFEKMLYDNAQLVSRYAEAYAQAHTPRYKQVVEETLAFVVRELGDSAGGFYSALDADSEGQEGKFYVWEHAELGALLGGDAELAKTYFGVNEAGNFEGRTILHVPHVPEAVAEAFGLTAVELEERLEDVKKTLLNVRATRVRPGLDDKVLASWNGLMLSALSDAGRVLEREDYLEAARKTARFMRDKMYREGRLLHTYKSSGKSTGGGASGKTGEAKVTGLLEDYALVGLGLMSLYRATLESEWLLWALELGRQITEHFSDAQGGFFSTADDAEALIVRPKDVFDSATPAANAAAALLLGILSRYTGERAWETLAVRALSPLQGAMARHPNGFGTSLCALEQLLSPPREVALFGDRTDPETQAFLEVLSAHPLPHAAVALIEREDDPLVSRLAFLQGRGPLDGKPTAYVCEGGACKLPVTSAEALRVQLEGLRS